MSGVARGLVAAIGSIHWYGQLQAGIVTTLVDAQHPGGVGVVVSENILGLGGVLALRYERDPQGEADAVRQGLLGSAAFEVRPVALARSELHRLFDPHVSVGVAFGAAGGDFRTAPELGVGLDVGLMPWLTHHPALTVQYRVRPLQVPNDYGVHLLQLGTAWRVTF